MYTWGKGDGYRLGHGTLETIRIPKMLEALQGKHLSILFMINVQNWRRTCIFIFLRPGVKIVELSLGASHGIALASEGALYAWGTHERAQITRHVPQLLQVLNPSFKANGNYIFGLIQISIFG